MAKRIVSTEHAPAAIGAYSQAVVIDSGRLVFCSGQIAIDPTTGKLLNGPVRAQTERILVNLRAVLEAAGSGLDRVVKITVFLTDMDNFEEFNQAYAGFFTTDPPARATVEVSRLPKGAAIEMDAIAYI
ncbi:MAG: RidA family protein [candidate division Zixibacteria bacterium]|nr:RidA family protein [candidate division Zixibacteria bacterium]